MVVRVRGLADVGHDGAGLTDVLPVENLLNRSSRGDGDRAAHGLAIDAGAKRQAACVYVRDDRVDRGDAFACGVRTLSDEFPCAAFTWVPWVLVSEIEADANVGGGNRATVGTHTTSGMYTNCARR